jgi:polysaccharide export outer membrane protein
MTISPRSLLNQVRRCLAAHYGKLVIAGAIGAGLAVAVENENHTANGCARPVAPAPAAPVGNSGQTAWHARAPWQSPDVTGENSIQLCQHVTPASPCPTPAVDCVNDCCRETRGWKNALGPVPDFQEYSQGEYVGRARLPHVSTYRLRVDDSLEFVFRVTREEIPNAYEINVGDEMIVESATDQNLRRNLIVLPDGTITLPLLGQVRAAHRTVPQLKDDLDKLYRKYYKVPAITVTPIKVDTQLEDLRYTVSGRSGFGGQFLSSKVTPEGTVQLPAVGSVPAQGLTIDEFTREVNARFAEKIQGVEVIPVLRERAPRYVFVLGEVRLPGRYTLEAPTTVMQAIAMAGSYNNGAHIAQVIVFRRADDWRLIATTVDLRNTLLGKIPCPQGEIWLSDADLVLVPKSRILWTTDMIELFFTKGLYGVVPFSGTYSYTNFTELGSLGG